MYDRFIDGIQNLVYRYDTLKAEDGVGGEEGTFCLCTLWCVEALTRAGETDGTFLRRAISMFEVRRSFLPPPSGLFFVFAFFGFSFF